MPSIPFCGATYQGRSSNIDASRSVNWYPELTGTQDNKTQINMVGTPGLNLFAISLGGVNIPVRGLTNVAGKMYAVVGTKLYSITTGGVVSAALGTLSTSSGRVDFASNGTTASGIGGNQLLIVDGTAGYIYNVVTTTFSTISGGGFPSTPKQCEYLDGYFIVTNGTMSYWVSNLYDGLTWNALATSPVSATPDNIVGLISHRQQLFFLKTLSTEVWYNAGIATSTGSPFQRTSGAVYDYGIVAEFSLAKGGSSFYFLCSQTTEDGGETVGVAEITEYSPVMISTPAINYRISQATELSSCFGYCYSEQGHMFYVLTNPTDNWTIVYDSTTKMWHERSSLSSSASVVNRHLGNCYTFFNNKHYVGDYRNCSIYEMSSAYLTDNGNPILSFRTAQTLWDNNDLSNIFINKLTLDIETGVGTNTPVIISITPTVAGWSGSANVLVLADGNITAGAMLQGSTDPQITLCYSSDGGHTWSAERSVTMGAQAAYTTRVVWRLLGMGRNKIFRVASSAGVKKNLIGAYIEVSK